MYIGKREVKLHNEIETITKISLWLVDKTRRKKLGRTPSVSSGKTKINYTMGELRMEQAPQVVEIFTLDFEDYPSGVTTHNFDRVTSFSRLSNRLTIAVPLDQIDEVIEYGLSAGWMHVGGRTDYMWENFYQALRERDYKELFQK